MSLDSDIEKIRRIANQNTPLTQREEFDLISTLHLARPDHVRTLAVMFEEDPRYAELFYANYQAKKRAIQNGDTEAWNRIIQNEVRNVRELMGIGE